MARILALGQGKGVLSRTDDPPVPAASVQAGAEGTPEQGAAPRAARHAPETKRSLQNRLHRIEGQVRGLARMVEQDAVCDDVLNQVASVEAALNGVRRQLLEAHIRSCIVDQLAKGEPGVVDELMQTIGRMVP